MELLTDVTIFKHKLWALEYVDRMKKWFNGFKQAPIRIDAELHTRCNLNCRICARRDSAYERFTEEERNRMEIPVKKWVQIAEESGKMGVKAWNISGLCEPLVMPDILFPTMRMIKAYDMFGELTTNGTLWDENYIKKMIEMGWDSICISIDAPDAETYDYIRGVKGAFKKAVQTLQSFNRIKKIYKTNLPIVTVNMVLNKLNYLKLKKMVEMVYNFGGNAIFVEPMVIFTSLCEPLKMDEKEIKKFAEHMDEAKELAQQHGIVLDITAVAPGDAFSGKKKFDERLIEKTGNMKEVLINEANSYKEEILSIPCYYPWFYLMIRADGNTIHCGEWKVGEESIKNKTLSDVWFGQKFDEIRRQFERKELSFFCEKCRPNVVEDIHIVRKSIKEFGNIEFLRGKYLEFLEENKRLKQELLSLKRRGNVDDKRCVGCKYKKEFYKFQNSLTFNIFSHFWDTKIERMTKKILRR